MNRIETITIGNTTYNLTQSNESPINKFYTDKEIKVGTWIDGKPLYKVDIYTHTPLSSSNWVDFITLSSECTIRVIRDAFFDSSDNNFRQYGYTGSKSTYGLYRFKNNVIQLYLNNSDWGNQESYLSILYTKTTD